MAESRLSQSVSNWIAIATSIATMLGAIILLYSVEKIAWFNTHPTWQKIADEIGAIVFVTGLISILWELRARRALVDEIFAAAKLSERLRQAGVTDATADFLTDLDWQPFFDGAKEVDVFFAYGGGWRGLHVEQLRTLNKRAGARLRIILPDPTSKDTVTELARRFGYSEAELVGKINDSIKAFRDFVSEPGAKATIEVWVLPKSPLYSFYRFDDRAIFALYQHKGIRVTVPAFTIRRGSLFAFFESELDVMISGNNPTARIVFKSP
ncbi:MAG TPA: hypothetical protein VGQ76_18310 [Thermoanaerobaculia bacterium]|jgi:hypothetical protein|nr:hypothetical protein [Thermoanaerobaculia bacterium]